MEFPYIAGAIGGRESIHCCFWYLLNFLPHTPREYIYEMQDKLTYVIPTFPQGRYENRKYIQPIVKIAAEFGAGDHVSQIAMSGGHDADVDAILRAVSQS